jgi:acyl carrier protein
VNMLEAQMKPASPTATPEEVKLAQLIVSALNLEIDAADIDPEAPLYGEGLGLDSIDILEIALAISQTYKVKLRSDDAKNLEIFSSLRSLSRHIQLHRSG